MRVPPGAIALVNGLEIQRLRVVWLEEKGQPREAGRRRLPVYRHEGRGGAIRVRGHHVWPSCPMGEAHSRSIEVVLREWFDRLMELLI